eukprot:1957071-Prymnesium_polylepis.1
MPWGAGCRVLLVGNPAQAFKGWDIALQALSLVSQQLPSLHVTWICQAQPQLTGVTFPVEFVVDPPQEVLPAHYRAGHDVMLFTSRFEAWGMPVLEAMASGLAVVTSHCFGVEHFARDRDNCRIVPSRDVQAVATAVLELLQDGATRASLAYNGRQTALRFTLERTGDALEDALARTAAFFGGCSSPQALQRLQDARGPVGPTLLAPSGLLPVARH